MGEDENKSFWERVEEIGQEEDNKRKKSTEDVPFKAIRRLAEQAENETVTPERLIGDEQFFTEVISFLEEGEQPHFLFPLTTGLLADSALVVESGAEREELLSKLDGGSCVVTDRYIRIVSNKGEWTIPYNSVASVDFVGHPALHVQTSGRTYYIKIAGTIFDEEKNLSEAATFIREKQREATLNDSSDEEDALEKLDKLGELREKGVITEEEFKKKKKQLLEDI